MHHRAPSPKAMRRLGGRGFFVLLLGLLVSPLAPARAQTFAGNFLSEDDLGAPLWLQLLQAGDGSITGSLSGSGAEFRLQARVVSGMLIGTLDGVGGAIHLEGGFDGGVLLLDLANLGPTGAPDRSSTTRFAFVPQATAGNGSPVIPDGMEGGPESWKSRPLAPGFTEDHPMVREWVAFLSGRKLTQIDSYSSYDGSGVGGGYSSEQEAVLCSDRRFASRGESSVSADVGGVFGNGGGGGGGEGEWLVITNGVVVGLVLLFQDGSASEFQLEMRDGQLYANGTRTFVTEAEVCL